METKTLAIIVAVVLVLLALPLLLKAVAPGGGTESAAPAEGGAAPVIPSDPPLLNASNLPGSVWEVEVQKGIKIQVTINPGGQAVAYTDNFLVKQMAGTDTLAGSWSVEGNKLKVAAHFQGKDYGTDLIISGDKVYNKDGTQITRVR